MQPPDNDRLEHFERLLAHNMAPRPRAPTRARDDVDSSSEESEIVCGPEGFASLLVVLPEMSSDEEAPPLTSQSARVPAEEPVGREDVLATRRHQAGTRSPRKDRRIDDSK